MPQRYFSYRQKKKYLNPYCALSGISSDTEDVRLAWSPADPKTVLLI